MPSIREKAGWACVCALALLLIASLAGAVQGGPLDPDGSPQSTMKPLDQIEPRTPISALPFTIDEAGSYYLTADLSLGSIGSAGISVNAAYVTLDLNGFSLVGPGIAGAGDGISAANIDGVRVVDGTVRGWANGVVLTGDGSSIEHVTAISNSGTGLSIGRGGTLRDSVVTGNGTGISAADASVTDNRVYQNLGNGIVVTSIDGALVERNDVTDNEVFGIFLTIDAKFVRVADNTMAHNYAGLNVHGTNNMIIRNVVHDNEVEYGINPGNTTAPFVGPAAALSTATTGLANVDN